MSKPNNINPYALLAFRAFVVSYAIAACCYFFGIINVSKKVSLSSVLIAFGTLAVWTSYFFYQTKQPIPRRRGKPIEFNNDPGNHTSSVLASLLIGLFCFFMAMAVLINA